VKVEELAAAKDQLKESQVSHNMLQSLCEACCVFLEEGGRAILWVQTC
jgi:hypothetical protein